MKPAALLVLAIAGCSNPAVPAADPVLDLIRGLRSEDVDERDQCEGLLLKTGATAIPVLKKVENDSDPEVRARVARILDALDPSRNAPPFDPSLTFQVDDKGVVTCADKEVARCGDADHVKKLEAFFEEHRTRVKRETGSDKYPLQVRVSTRTPFEHVQVILMIATHHGAVTRVQMGTK